MNLDREKPPLFYAQVSGVSYQVGSVRLLPLYLIVWRGAAGQGLIVLPDRVFCIIKFRALSKTGIFTLMFLQSSFSHCRERGCLFLMRSLFTCFAPIKVRVDCDWQYNHAFDIHLLRVRVRVSGLSSSHLDSRRHAACQLLLPFPACGDSHH